METTPLRRSGESKTSKTRHQEVAKRFMEMVVSLDAIEPVYNWQCMLDSKSRILPPREINERSFLKHHLRWWLYSLSTAITVYCKPDAGLRHHIPENSRKVEDGRRDLPKSIVDALVDCPTEIPWRAKRVRGLFLRLCLCLLLSSHNFRSRSRGYRATWRTYIQILPNPDGNNFNVLISASELADSSYAPCLTI